MSMFSQQHYYKIGAILARRLAIEVFEGRDKQGVEGLVGSFVVEFQEDNANFNENRFLQYVQKKFAFYCELLGVEADAHVHSNH